MATTLAALTTEEVQAFDAFLVQSGSTMADINLMFLLETEPDEIVEDDELLDSF